MLATSFLLQLANKFDMLRKKFVVIHRGRYSNTLHYGLLYEVVTWDGDPDVKT